MIIIIIIIIIIISKTKMVIMHDNEHMINVPNLDAVYLDNTIDSFTM